MEINKNNRRILGNINELIDEIYFDTDDYGEELEEIISEVLSKFNYRFDLDIDFKF